jgi:hypothetical protein
MLVDIEDLNPQSGGDVTRKTPLSKRERNHVLNDTQAARDQAVSLIVQDFMDVSIPGLPKALGAEMKSIVNAY